MKIIETTLTLPDRQTIQLECPEFKIETKIVFNDLIPQPKFESCKIKNGNKIQVKYKAFKQNKINYKLQKLFKLLKGKIRTQKINNIFINGKKITGFSITYPPQSGFKPFHQLQD